MTMMSAITTESSTMTTMMTRTVSSMVCRNLHKKKTNNKILVLQKIKYLYTFVGSSLSHKACNGGQGQCDACVRMRYMIEDAFDKVFF